MDKNDGFRLLFRAAWLSVPAMLGIMLLQIVVFTVFPPPDTVLGFFTLYRQSPFLGLLDMDLLYLLNNLILVVLYLALGVLLYGKGKSAILLALVFGMIGIACYYPSNPAFEMLRLSRQYFEATPQRQDFLLAAGEAMLAGYTGTSFDAYYVCNAIALLLFAGVLLVSRAMGKATAVWGMLAGVLMIIPSSAGTLGMIFSLSSLVPWAVFIVRLMPHFKKVARDGIVDA